MPSIRWIIIDKHTNQIWKAFHAAPFTLHSESYLYFDESILHFKLIGKMANKQPKCSCKSNGKHFTVEQYRKAFGPLFAEIPFIVCIVSWLGKLRYWTFEGKGWTLWILMIFYVIFWNNLKLNEPEMDLRWNFYKNILKNLKIVSTPSPTFLFFALSLILSISNAHRLKTKLINKINWLLHNIEREAQTRWRNFPFEPSTFSLA